ncbi:MAG: glycosyltransferase [Parvibaculum sp.]
MSHDKITLAFPNYNHEKFLGRAISGLANQAHAANEILILDDASTDGSVEILMAAAQDLESIHLILLEENGGVLKALNRLLQEATGDWIGYAAADDYLFPGYLEAMLPIIRANPNVGFVSACVEVWDGDDVVRGTRPIFYPSLEPKVFSPSEARVLMSQSDNHFMGHVTLYRREALLALGGFDEDFGSGTDGMALRDLALMHGFGFVPKKLGIWRLHGENFSLSSAFDIPKFAAMIEKHKSHILANEVGFYPERYEEILERRMKFGVARILLNSMNASNREKLVSDVAELLKMKRADLKIVTLLSKLKTIGPSATLAWVFFRLWPFSPLRFLLQPFRRRYAAWKNA